MIISKNFKMAELIHLNYEILSVLKRFDIKLGFKDLTINELCLKENINTDFFIEIVNSFNNKEYFPQNKLREYPVNIIINYLKNSHSLYINKKIPEIEKLIENLKFNLEEDKNKQLIQNFFLDYKKEFTEHILREEERIYPYIITLEKNILEKKTSASFFEQIKSYSIIHYQSDHNDVEEKLFDLKNLIIKYLPPPRNPEIYSSILVKLFKLEKEINEHTLLEEKVVIPKVLEMEKQFFFEIDKGKIKIQ